MTPEEIKQKARIIKQAFNDDEGLNLLVHAARCVDELESSALRLAAIEAAGDEEVESLHEGFYKLLPLNTLEARRCGAFDTAIELLQERNATIADLRAKLGEAEKALEEMEIQYTEVLINTRNLAVQKSEAQSSEIAGLRETVERLEKELGVAYLSINGAFLVIEPTLRMLEAKRTPAPIPNPSEIPNSSTEVQDAAKGC